MPITLPIHLSDQELLDATAWAAVGERRATVELLVLLAELDVRRLFLGQGCASLFTYCTQVMHLSEHAAYHRIEAARAARQFPVILAQLADGALTLTAIALLRPHLTRENHEHLLANARHKSKREVEQQIACLAPKPDARPLVRKLPAPAPIAMRPKDSPTGEVPIAVSAALPMPAPKPAIAPLAADRYVLKVTVSAETHAKLRRAQDLLRHAIPNGDAAMILDRALSMLVAQLERRKTGRLSRPSRMPARPAPSRGRHIPAAVKRNVWTRDAGRCAFIGPHGPCRETGFLEYHHVVPYARGGASDAANLELRCRAHNQFEAVRELRV